jgi:hypothetical protein
LLAAPPTTSVPWRWETQAVPDGWPGDSVLSVTNADLWHDHGWRGQGVKVAMFDLQWYGAEIDARVAAFRRVRLDAEELAFAALTIAGLLNLALTLVPLALVCFAWAAGEDDGDELSARHRGWTSV